MRFYTAGCVNKMAVSVTGPRALNELGGPVIPGNTRPAKFTILPLTHSHWDLLISSRKYYDVIIRAVLYILVAM